ncbi:CsgG/HfaB family protein [Ochrobactrum sp. BTU1]|jgi:curli biogenesis system outer membrane secretion channel CsgG|uniref:CsgG/HfaB family protein n=1 Tax=Ochrobactrum sp. BTU1 TaxID=2840456 RepID=UPI001C0402B6|nr:hypothetical protein KMS41_24955 [Ochrobactrum sp. BTU1]
MIFTRTMTAIGFALSLSACTATAITPPKMNAKLLDGPPISDIVTPFDRALTCLNGRISKNVIFSVGAILDQTGKESFTDGGVGKFVTQGAGDMVQSALFKAGTTIVNRRDPRVTTTEMEWKIRDNRRIIPTSYYVTGSINSLDFIPGGGVEAEVAGVGAKYRQNRMLVGIDLALTDAASGRIVANVPIHKQIYASEYGATAGRFFGDTLVNAQIGGREREALHFALRQMLYLGTFELLTQVMAAQNYADCRSHIEKMHGDIEGTSTGKAVAALAERKAQEPQSGKDLPAAPTVPTVTSTANTPTAEKDVPNNLQQKSLMKWDAAKGGWVPGDSGAEASGS